MTNRSPDNELPFVIGHFADSFPAANLSLFICHLRVLCGREKKCIAGFQPAKVVLTQKELSRLRCRRDAGATIFSHDLCLRGGFAVKRSTELTAKTRRAQRIRQEFASKKKEFLVLLKALAD